MSSLDLTGKRILITGGLGAIGRVVVRILAEHGAHMLVNDILTADEAREVMAVEGMTHLTVSYHACDCRDLDAVRDLFGRLEAEQHLPHIVCCHAGLVHPGRIDTFSLREFDETMELNLRSAFVVSRTAVQHWRHHRIPGHLIYTTSWVQDVPWPDIMAYTVSKSGMRTLMRGFARELAPDGIRANAIAPGIVGVGMARKQWDTDPAYQARASKAIPLGMLQTPESVAHGFLFLCSDLAAYMTGSVLLMDGGCSLYPMD